MYPQTKKVVLEVSAVIALWCVLGELVIFLSVGVNVRAMLGFLLGSVLAVAAFIHMGFSTEHSLDTLSEIPAKRKHIVSFVIRIVILIAVLVAAFLSGWFNLLAIVFGLFGLKVGAYLQPLVDKMF